IARSWLLGDRRHAISATLALGVLANQSHFRRDDGNVRRRHVYAIDGLGSLLSRRSFAGVRDDVQTGRPKTVQPALALADFGSKPRSVMIYAGLRTEALEPATMPYQAELAMAVSAMIFHSLLPVWHLG